MARPAKNKIEFRYGDWIVWFNDNTGDWGAILSKRGERPLILDGRQSKKEIIKAIKDHRVKL